MEGIELKKLRKDMKLSRKEMADRLGGYKARTVMSWENGERKVPKAVEKLIKLMEQI